MTGVWRTVRVFISSTFRDMHSERDWLVKRVFPALRERLEKYRVHLIDIDLRWGVTEHQAESGGALDVCLDQIDDCRPFFLGILGERYGFVSTELLERIRSNSKYDSLKPPAGVPQFVRSRQSQIEKQNSQILLIPHFFGTHTIRSVP